MRAGHGKQGISLEWPKLGHYQRVCRNTINAVTTSPQPEDEKFLGAITQENSEPWIVQIQVNRRPVNFKIDTAELTLPLYQVGYTEETEMDH